MASERVVITGLGTINAIAGNASEFYHALKNGVCGIGPVSLFDTAAYRTQTGAEVKCFDPCRTLNSAISLKRMSRADLLAMTATMEALADGGLWPLSKNLQMNLGVVIGGGAGGMLECEEVFRAALEDDNRSFNFSSFASFCCASSTDHIASKLGLQGPKATFMTACSSSATAIGYALDLIRDRNAKVVIAGGTEPMSRITYAAFNALQAVDPEHCRPFDKERQGLSLGEGAAILILESLDHALKRRARIYGEVAGYGISCDAHHMTAPDPDAAGAVRCMQAALKDAHIPASTIDYINAHGTGTPANDQMETKGIKTVFGGRAYTIPVSSTKAMTGHTLGAAGAIEAVATVLAIYRKFIPPTIHLTTPDPECDLDYVVDGVREKVIKRALSNSFAFGGNNTTLILQQYDNNGVQHE